MGKKLDIVLEDLVIERIAAEGKALTHTSEGMVVFVEFAVPGDVVDVRIIKKKKAYMEGRIIALKKPSEQRLAPFCKHFGLCGGCKWQPLPYNLQLEAKRQQVYDQLVRIGHLEVPEIQPVLGSEKTEYYRNKLEFTFSERRWILPDEEPEGLTDVQRLGLGFHVGKFFDKVLDIEDCHLQRDPSNAIRLFIKDWAISHSLPFYNLRGNYGLMRNMFVRTGDEGTLMVILCFAEESPAILPMMEAIAQRFPEITSLYYVVNTKRNDTISDQECILFKGEPTILGVMEGLRFRIGPKSFYQTNSGQAYRLYCVAREFAALTGSETVYDLYTGTGTIAQFVSPRAAKVIGIEYVPEAIEDARLNAEANGITNCEFFAGDMKDVLTDDFIAEHGAPDVMIVDPPRAGMHPDVVYTIIAASPRRIVYVSCNPASQARDCYLMSAKYEITRVQPVDMFPHTQHVENVCLLELKEN